MATPLWAAVDPTRPSGAPGQLRTQGQNVSPLPELRLQGIRVMADRRQAVINGRLLMVGDRIDGARLVAIEQAAVVLNHAGRKQRLVMGQPLHKRWTEQDK